MERVKLDISTWSFIKILLLLLILAVIWLAKDVIFLVILILIVVAALAPLVDSMEKVKIPRILAVIIVYLAAILILVAIGLLIIPPLVNQIRLMAENLPNLIERLMPTFYSIRSYYTGHGSIISISQSALDTISGQLSNIGSNIFSATVGVINGLIAVITFAVLTFYLLLDKGNLRKFFESILPTRNREAIFEVLSKVAKKWGGWLRSQLMVSAILGTVVGIGLAIIGVPYALTLGIVAGLFEFIPMVGAALGAIPAILVALTVNPWKALIVLVFFIIIQQLENHILIPKIMGRMVDLSPVIIIVAILIAAKLFGAIGVVVAIPLTAGIVVILQEWKEYQEKHQS